MEHYNLLLFALLNAGAHPAPLSLAVARVLADGLIWSVPLGLALGWLRGGSALRRQLLLAFVAALLALGANQLIGLAWYHPRPFEVGVGHTWIPHARDSSFPSDHLSLIWSLAFSLLAERSTRAWGGLVALLGLPVAWARIYLGVHFPLDMAGAALVALLSTGLVRAFATAPLTTLTPALEALYRRLFAPLIARGWVRN